MNKKCLLSPLLWLALLLPSLASAAVIITPPGVTCAADTRLTAPVQTQDVCFESTTHTWKVWNGTTWVGASLAGQGASVFDFGAKGDGTTDDTAAFTGAIASGVARIFAPCGFSYRITAGLTLTTAQTIASNCLPGSAINGIAAVLKHDFNGDFITFTGTNGVNDAGTGGGLERLQLVQVNGNGSGTSGVAVKLVAGSSTFFPARVRLDALQIETGNGANSWQYGIYAAGIADTVHGLTDLYVSRSRIVGDTNSTAAILLENARNAHLFENQLTGTNGHLSITGGAGANEQSSGVYVSNVSGANLTIDRAANVTVMGGGWTAATITANAVKALVIPGALNGAPSVGGTNNLMLALNNSSGETHLRTSGNATFDFGGGGMFRILANLQFGTPFLFANIAGNLTANGQIGYCSDCTIANPCAGGGTGAIAKRLNGVNVCN